MKSPIVGRAHPSRYTFYSKWVVILCTSLFWLGFWGASGCSETDKEKETKCDKRGECVITYRYSEEGVAPKIERKCKKIEKLKDEECGKCKNIKRFATDDFTKGLPSQKTCGVCNLCTGDFECIKDSDCKAGTPYCSEGVCVACRGSQDCKGDRPFCTSNGCVGCLDDKDCKNAELPQCLDGACGECRCNDGKKKHCLKKKDQTVQCVECRDNLHCQAPAGNCDLKEYRCVAECKEDKDCGVGQFCSEGACGNCRSHQDCKDGKKPRCNKGKCGCLQHSDCSTDFPRCVEGGCVECVKESDCPPGFSRCVGGECLLRLCQTDKQCQHPSYSLCKRLGRRSVCVGCLSDSDCAAGRKCELTSFTCK